MSRTLALFLASFVAVSLAVDCNNPLLSTLSVTGVATPQLYTGTQFCKSLQNKDACCTTATINEFQTRAQALSDKLNAVVKTRDQAWTDLRQKTIPSLQANLNELNNILSQMSGGMSGASMLGGFDKVFGSLVTLAPTLKAALPAYQKSRANCIVELVKLQSSAWCLACDPDYASKGVTGNIVPLSTTVCSRLQNTCYDFVAGAAAQSALFAVESANTMLSAMVSAMRKLAAGDFTALADLATALPTKVTAAPTGDLTKNPVKIPTGCTSKTNCNWICTNFIKIGKVDETTLALGGEATLPGAFFNGDRLLEEDEEIEVIEAVNNNRRLAGGEWDPAEDESGVTVTFTEDPAGAQAADPASGSIVKASFVCLIAMLAVFLF